MNPNYCLYIIQLLTGNKTCFVPLQQVTFLTSHAVIAKPRGGFAITAWLVKNLPKLERQSLLLISQHVLECEQTSCVLTSLYNSESSSWDDKIPQMTESKYWTYNVRSSSITGSLMTHKNYEFVVILELESLI